MTTEPFLAIFRKAPNALRFDLLVRKTEESPYGMSNILDILAAGTIAPDLFVEALQFVANANPRNLPALRALTWHNIREGNWSTAKDFLVSTIERFPTQLDCQAELLRLEMMAPTNSIEHYIKLAAPILKNPLLAASYRYQLATANPSTVCDGQKDLLVRELEIAISKAFRTAFDSDPSISRQSRQIFWRHITGILQARDIAVVGNGPSLLGQQKGEEIDAHDFVIRCNFPVLSPFAEDVGRRTDLIIFNEAILPRLKDFLKREILFCSIPLLSLHPEPLPTVYLEDTERSLGVQVGRLPSPFRTLFRSICYTRPTTGLMTIICVALAFRKKLSLYGFDFYGGSARHHYFPQSAALFLGHEIDYEAFFVRDVIPQLFPNQIRDVSEATNQRMATRQTRQ